MLGLLCSIVLLLDTTPHCPPTPIKIDTGYFSQYGQAPTDGTIAYRQFIGQLPMDMSEYDGVIAVSDCDLIGEDAWIKINGSRWLRVITFDCAGSAQTVEWMESNNIIGELCFYLAERFAIIGQGGIRGQITFEEPIETWQRWGQQSLSSP